MSNYPKPKSESSPFSGCIESSVFALRERERQFFSEDPQSPIALRLASIRGELQRLLAGECVRVDVIERSLAPPSELPESFGCDLATEPEAVEVVAGG